jgi:hypothetical protein
MRFYGVQSYALLFVQVSIVHETAFNITYSGGAISPVIKIMLPVDADLPALILWCWPAE